MPAVKPGEHWDFPSAASIPPVSIMGAEPPMPKGAEPSTPKGTEAQAQAQTKPATDAKASVAQKTPLPQAAPAATR
jgi:hypothetical protein